MAQALSDDLRRRVVAAVMEGGMSRRGAAQRFGIAPSTAIKWVDACRPDRQLPARAAGRRPALAADRGAGRGGARPDRGDAGHDAGGDRRASGGRARAAGLAEHGVALLPPPGHHVQKKPRMPASSSAWTCCGAAAPGSRPSPASTPTGWSSSMVRRTVAEGRVSRRTGRRPRWPGDAAGLCADSAAARRCRTGTGRPPPSSAPCGWAA